MLIKVLQSKIRYAVITKSDFKYHGSLGLDEDLMDELGVVPWQVVNVNSIDGSLRTETYLIPEKRGSGACVARGALANFLLKGDQCHVNVYCHVSQDTAHEWEPIIIESNL